MTAVLLISALTWPWKGYNTTTLYTTNLLLCTSIQETPTVMVSNHPIIRNQNNMMFGNIIIKIFYNNNCYWRQSENDFYIFSKLATVVTLISEV